MRQRADRARFVTPPVPEKHVPITYSAFLAGKTNPWLKRFRAALAGERGEANAVGVEGPHLVEEALHSAVEILAVLACPAGEKHLSRLGLTGAGGKEAAGPPLLRTTDKLFGQTANTEAPQGIAALVRMPDYGFDDLMRGVALVPVLFGVQDPGNVGAIVRSANAFGATGLIAIAGSASPYGPKAMRASAGSAFRLPILIRGQIPVLLAQLRVAGVKLVATVAAGGVRGLRSVSLEHADLRGPSAILIGSEAHGLPENVLAAADLAIRIQVSGSVESLNAAVAASVVLYEAGRQRSVSWREGPQHAAHAAAGSAGGGKTPNSETQR